MIQAAFIGDPHQIERVYAQGRREKLEDLVPFFPDVLQRTSWEEHLADLGQVRYLFSTWGMPKFTAAQIGQWPALEAVFYAAGSVRGFAPPFLDQGVAVVSAWGANAIPVAEFTLAQILLATKGYFQNTRQYSSPTSGRQAYRGRGNFGATIALLGAGQIGRYLIGLLRPFNLRLVVFDPFLSEAEASALGVEKVSLDQAFAQGQVVSNHLANLPETVGMLREEHFGSMPNYGVFINTGRGATVNEAELVEVLQRREDLFALLDVTHPEPPPADSLLFILPNVQLSTHIAGSLGDEVVRMADYMIEEFLALRAGQTLRYAVTPEMLATMA